MYFGCACDWAIAHPRKSAEQIGRRVRRSSHNEHAGAAVLLMQIKGRNSWLANLVLASALHSATAARSAGSGIHIHSGCGFAAGVSTEGAVMASGLRTKCPPPE
jgi:hypothetical protein